MTTSMRARKTSGSSRGRRGESGDLGIGRRHGFAAAQGVHLGDASPVGAQTPARRAEQMESFGVGHAEALQIAGVQGAEMKQAVLALYRSAAQPAMAELGKGLSSLASRPGLALVATADPFGGSEELRRRAAERAGAEVAVLDGLGHWWMAEDPARGARMLTAFWRARAWSA
jgi:hypothetical protein